MKHISFGLIAILLVLCINVFIIQRKLDKVMLQNKVLLSHARLNEVKTNVIMKGEK